MKIRTVIESPFKAGTPGGTAQTVCYARRCLLDSLKRGEAPFASHLLYPQVLADEDLEQRRLGITAGLDLVRDFERTAVYFDLGVPAGVVEGIVSAIRYGREISLRSVSGSTVQVQLAVDKASQVLEQLHEEYTTLSELLLGSEAWDNQAFRYGALKISWDLSSCTFAANAAPIRTPW